MPGVKRQWPESVAIRLQIAQAEVDRTHVELDLAILAADEAGMTKEAIGECLGITRQAVSQRLERINTWSKRSADAIRSVV